MRSLVVVALPLLISGCMDQNYGLESQHKPIVADGRAYVRGCPDWRSQDADSAAMTDSNYGCATNANLAAMIADPQDLVRGKAAALGDSSDVATKAITGWRSPATTGGGASAAPRGSN